MIKSYDRKRHHPDVRRRMILEAARQCIAERGIAATTVREVAAQAGISSGTVTYHFASIDDILMEVLRTASIRLTENVLAAARSLPTATDRLDYVIDANLPDRAEALEVWRLWLDLWARAAWDARLAAVHSERHAFERRALADLIQEGIISGEFAPLDADSAAAEFLGLLDGLGLQAAIGDTEMNSDRARSLLRDMVRRLLRGVR